ncbi:MAG: hypothetical protein N4A71_02900 [Carboxylicivirga sp.]|jgi:hypothetical protein|nr:hypothetical protein [Carboxylicivirga sp.]
MKNFVIVFLIGFGLWACENPYENVSDPKYYDDDPFVSLSSEQAVVRMGLDEEHNHSSIPGVYRDSLVLSHKLDHDINVTLEWVQEETNGEVGTNFSFQKVVSIDAGQNYGHYNVTGLDFADGNINSYKLAVRIKGVDDQNVIAGLYGSKKENQARPKRFKTYSFQK